MEMIPMSRRLDKPTFKGDFKEPTIEIIVRWKESYSTRQHKLTEICVYNEQEYDDLINGIHRTVNAIVQART